MDRRSFLSRLGQAVAGATVAYSFPSIIVPRNIQPITDSYFMAPHGLAYLINDSSRILRGLSTVTFPDLNSPVADLSGAMLSPQMFDHVRKSLNAALFRTGKNPVMYP